MCAQYRRLLGGEKYEPKEEARHDARKTHAHWHLHGC
jgi:hypothetical protein